MPLRFASTALCFLLLGLGLCACARRAKPPEGYGVNLTIDAQPMSARAEVRRLRITASGAESYTHTVDVAGAIADRGYAQVRYVPGVDQGELSFAIEALDGLDLVRGHGGDGPITLLPGGAVNLVIALADAPGANVDGGTDAMLPMQCVNGVLDPGEIDVDCGGPSCPACEPGRSCTVPADCATQTCTNGHCELASGPPSWVPIAALPAGRSYAAGAGLDDGRIYAIGGIVGGNPTSTVLAFSQDTNDWTAAADLPAVRAIMPAVTTMNHVYLPGGVYSPSAGMLDSYADVLSSTTPPPAFSTFVMLGQKRAYHGAALAGDGRIYVAGGAAIPDATPLDTMQAFALDMSPVVDAPKLPVARADLALAADASGRLIAVGGRLGDNSVTGRVDVFDPTAQTWSDGPALSVPRRLVAAVQGGDGRVYAVGGSDAAGGPLADVEVLSGDGARWLSLPPITPARYGMGIARGWDGRIYAIGGDVMGGSHTEVEAYGPRITPGPATAAPGTSIALSCSNFAADAKVTITFSGDPAGKVAAEGTTNALGNVTPSLVWQVPQVPAGTYTLTAVDDRARYAVRVRFVVP